MVEGIGIGGGGLVEINEWQSFGGGVYWLFVMKKTPFAYCIEIHSLRKLLSFSSKYPHQKRILWKKLTINLIIVL